MSNWPQVEFQPLGPWWVEGSVLLLTIAIWAYSLYTTKYQPVKIRILIGILRSLLLGFGLLLLHHPTLTRKVSLPIEKRLGVLIDRSGSMGAAAKDGKNRYLQAYDVLSSLHSQDYKVDVYEFDQTISEALGDRPSPRRLSGGKTDYYSTMAEFLASHGDYGALLILSDGHDLGRFSQMSAEETGRWLNRLGAPPINTLLVGDQFKGPEVAIHSIDAPAFSFVRAPLRIRATIIVRNLDNFQAKVQLLDGENLVQIKDLVLDDQGFGTVEFEFYPEQEGDHLFTISVSPHHLETNVENNSQKVLIEIGRDKINVLHIAGSVTWDLQGLRAMFERNQMVDLTAFYIMRTREHVQQGVDHRMIPPEEMALVPFPTEEIFDRQLFGFDVVVFQDFDAGNYFSDSYQARRLMKKIHEFVTKHRGGFVVIGGPRMAAGPSLALTPVADILALSPPTYRKAYKEESLRASLESGAASHPLLRRFDLDHQLFRGTMDGLTINKDANVLLKGENGSPLLATYQVGNGRTLFLNTSSSWKWRRDALAQGKTADGYYDFWEQVLKWVIQDPSMQQVRLITTKTVADPLAVEVEVLLRDRLFVPAVNKTATLRLISLDGKGEPVEQSFTTDQDGVSQLKFKGEHPGYYRIELVEEPWRGFSKPGTVFLGGSQDELRNLDLVPETLQRLASYSSGRFVTSTASFNPESLVWGQLGNTQVLETQRLKLRNWIWSLPLLICIAAIEWAVRRSSHLA